MCILYGGPEIENKIKILPSTILPDFRIYDKYIPHTK